MDFKIGDKIYLKDGSFVQIVKDPKKEGGQGKIYFVEWSEKGEKEYALKWYKPQYSIKNNPEFYNNLEKLSKLSKKFTGYFTFPLALTDEIDGEYGYVMEKIPDSMSSFSKIFKNPKKIQNTETRLKACINLSRAIMKLHLSNLCFVDLNPKGIFMDETGDIRICDCDNIPIRPDIEVDEEGNFSKQIDNDVSVSTSNVVATPEWSAPEVYTTRSCNKKTDVFALALLIFRMLLNEHPFEGKRMKGIKNEDDRRKIFIEDPKFIFGKDNEPRSPKVTEAWNHAPDEIRIMFTRIFLENIQQPDKRDIASSWYGALLAWQENLNEKLMPVIPIPERDPNYVLVIIIVDSSSSMSGQKMEEVNKALKTIAQDLKEIEDSDEYDVKISIAVLQYADEAIWLYDKPRTLDDFEFVELQTLSSDTEFGRACIELDSKLKDGQFIDQTKKYNQPVLILITDGSSFEYEEELASLKDNVYFKKSYKHAIGVDEKDDKSDRQQLIDFVDNEEDIDQFEYLEGKLNSILKERINLLVNKSSTGLTMRLSESVSKTTDEIERAVR